MSTEEPAAHVSRFRWLDRWLEPRWRALLTWGILTGLWSVTAAPSISPHINRFVETWHSWLLTQSPVPLPPITSFLAYVLTGSVLSLWYQPIILRLGWVRTCIWIAIGCGLNVSQYFPFPYSWLWWVTPKGVRDFVFVTLLTAAPAIACVGRRSRVWMAVPAGACYAGMVTLGESGKATWAPFLFWLALGLVLCGAVMLYGTDPLPRRPAERQPGED